MIDPQFKKLIEENTKEEFEKKFSVQRADNSDYFLADAEGNKVCECPYDQECPYECSCRDCWNNACQIVLIKSKEEN